MSWRAEARAGGIARQQRRRRMALVEILEDRDRLGHDDVAVLQHG